MSKQRGHTCLRIEIDGKDAITLEPQILGEMDGGGRLARAALEVHNGNHLEVFTVPAVRQIPAISPADLVEMAADLVDIIDGIGAPAAGGSTYLQIVNVV